MGPWDLGPWDLGPWDPGRDPGTLGPWDLGTWDPGTLGPWDPGTLGPGILGPGTLGPGTNNPRQPTRQATAKQPKYESNTEQNKTSLNRTITLTFSVQHALETQHVRINPTRVRSLGFQHRTKHLTPTRVIQHPNTVGHQPWFELRGTTRTCLCLQVFQSHVR